MEYFLAKSNLKTYSQKKKKKNLFNLISNLYDFIYTFKECFSFCFLFKESHYHRLSNKDKLIYCC